MQARTAPRLCHRDRSLRDSGEGLKPVVPAGVTHICCGRQHTSHKPTSGASGVPDPPTADITSQHRCLSGEAEMALLTLPDPPQHAPTGTGGALHGCGPATEPPRLGFS